MECFFWSVGIVFEPQYYSCRIMLTKVLALITTFDDIYDTYESLDDLKALTTFFFFFEQQRLYLYIAENQQEAGKQKGRNRKKFKQP
ncbi:putative (E)-beta-ocimene synthase [Helianthus annuus]|nr:putative (E)-beta-ocimene synthase [Helianthus annuus]